MALSRPLDDKVWLSAFALRKNRVIKIGTELLSPQKNAFTKEFILLNSIMMAREAGLIKYWKKWSHGISLNMDMCRNPERESGNKQLRSIKLIKLTSAFFVFGGRCRFCNNRLYWKKIICSYFINMNTEPSLQPACASRPLEGRIESSATAAPPRNTPTEENEVA